MALATARLTRPFPPLPLGEGWGEGQGGVEVIAVNRGERWEATLTGRQQTWLGPLTAMPQVSSTRNPLRMASGEAADFPARGGQNRGLKGGARQERRQRGMDSSLWMTHTH
jgi:hypothetical protein